MKTIVYFVLVVALTLIGAFSFSNNVLSGQVLEISGSTTCQKRFLEPAAQAILKSTNIEIRVSGVGTGKGLIALLDGKVKVSAASEDLEGAVGSAMKVAAESNRDLHIPKNLLFHEIMSDLIIPIVHKDNPVSELSWPQLRDIHVGVIRNWKEVGGLDLPIQVITSHTGSATKAVFQNLVMQEKQFAMDSMQVDSTRNEILAVSKNKGAIGAVSMGFMKMYSGNTKPIRTTKISRPLGLITVGPPDPTVKKVIEFLRSDEARKLYEY